MVIIQLKDILQTEWEIDFKNAMSNFTCKDKDVEHFLKNTATEFEICKKSRTYLIMDEDKFYTKNFVILAYFTLSLKTLSFRDNVLKRKIKNIDGFSKDIRETAAILIGQFGKDEIESQNICGSILFQLCLKTIYQIHNLAGGRIVLLECQNIEKIRAFYEKNEFHLL